MKKATIGFSLFAFIALVIFSFTNRPKKDQFKDDYDYYLQTLNDYTYACQQGGDTVSTYYNLKAALTTLDSYPDFEERASDHNLDVMYGGTGFWCSAKCGYQFALCSKHVTKPTFRSCSNDYYACLIQCIKDNH